MLDHIEGALEISGAVEEIVPVSPFLCSSNSATRKIYIAHYKNAPRFKIGEHSVPFHVLEINKSTSECFHRRRLGDNKFYRPLIDNQIFFCPANTPHEIEWESKKDFSLIIFDPKLFEDLFECSNNLVPLDGFFDFEIVQFAARIFNTIALGCGKNTYVVEAQEITFLDILHEKLSVKSLQTKLNEKTGTLSRNAIKKIDELIRDKISQGECISILEMANCVALSRSRFSKVFHSTVGLTPSDYRDKIRLEYADFMLLNTNKTIGYIADYLGFSNIGHFSFWFKKKRGVSPSFFRD